MANVAPTAERSRVGGGQKQSLARAVLAQLQRVFRRLRQAGVPFCILRNRDRIPDQLIEGSDVDLIVPARTNSRELISLLAGLRPVQIVAHRSTVETYFRVGPVFLHLDLLIGDRQWRGSRYLTNTEVLANAWDDNGMPVASLAHQAFCAWFSSLTRRRRFKPRYIPLIRDAARHAPDSLRRLLSETFGRRLGNELWELIDREKLEQSDEFATRCRQAIWWRALCRHPIATSVGALHHYWSEVRQYVRPSGVTVAIVGPDGAGKSAVCAALAASPPASLPFRSVETCHLYRRVLPMLSELRQGRLRRTPAVPVHVHDPHGKPPHHPLVSLFTLVYYAADQWLSRLRWSWPKLSKNTLLIQDRHLSEILVDAKRFRYGGPRWLAKWIIQCIPRSNLVILLDAPAEVLRRRKQEVPITETARQREAYRSLVGSMTTGRIVDASQSMEQVTAQVKETILQYLAERTSRRFHFGEPR